MLDPEHQENELRPSAACTDKSHAPLFRGNRRLVFLLLSLLICVYLAIGARILTVSSFLPYITDNVETYSNYIHAKNIYERGVRESFGLTDETYGDSPSSPTVVYTHQGNFPRLYTLAQFSLGIDTVEGQILATLLTIGTATVALAFLFLSRVANVILAFIAVLCLILNYVFFVQWQFDTYRIWHAFFIFLALWCACEIAEGKTLFFLVLCGVVFGFCFYFEIIFAVFLGLLFALFLTFLSWPNYARARNGILSCIAGAIVGAGTLFVQDIAYLGWEGFIRDLYYTYMIRNYSGPQFDDEVKLLESFYRENSVLYWYINNQDTSGWMNPKQILALHAWHVAMLLPPFLLITTVLAIGGWCFRIGQRILLRDYWKDFLRSRLLMGIPSPLHLLYVPGFAILAVLMPMLLLPVWAFPSSGRSSPFLLFAFLPWVYMTLCVLLQPSPVLRWLRRCGEADEAVPGTCKRVVRTLMIVALLVMTPAALAILFRGKPALSGFGYLHLDAAIRLTVVLSMGLLCLGYSKAQWMGDLIRKIAAFTRQDQGVASRRISNLAAILFLVGLYGVVLGAAASRWFPESVAPIVIAIPVALFLAARGYADSRGRIRKEEEVDVTYDTDEELRGRLSLAACIAVVPLLLVASAPTLVAVRLSFATTYAVFLFVLAGLCIPAALNYFRTQFLRFERDFHTNPAGFLAGLRIISGRATIFILLVLPDVLLHKSSMPQVMGRYSNGYSLFIVAYASYALIFLTLFFSSLLGEQKIIHIRNRVSKSLASVKPSATNVYEAVRVLIIVFVLVSSTGYLLSSAWRFLNITNDGGIAKVGNLYGLALVGALCIVAGVTKLNTGSYLGVGRLRLSSALFAGGLMLLVYWATVQYMVHLSPRDIELWKGIASTGLPKMVSWILVATATFLTLDLVLRPDHGGQFQILENGLRNIGVLMICGVCAYVAVLILAPGYILSAYLSRWAIFPAFLFILAFAIAGYTYLMTAYAWISSGRAVRSRPFPVATDMINRSI